jgi:cytochrome c biogenesis factor
MRSTWARSRWAAVLQRRVPDPDAAAARAARRRHALLLEEGPARREEEALLTSSSASRGARPLIPILAYGGFDLSAVGLTGGLWVILSALYEPCQRLLKKQSLSRGRRRHDGRAHRRGPVRIGVTVTQSYRIEKDIALRPGESFELKGYKFSFDSTKMVAGPNYDASNPQS